MFDHVQRMPVAFFTRTRTGALVSRLNNDVLGAQRAFSDTLSGVVGNLVTLALTLAVMLAISWQVTLLALLLLPVFVLPARRMGRRLAAAGARGRRPQRGDEHPDDRAVLRARRHPGQAVRAPGRGVGRVRRTGPSRVRDIGVRTAMVQWVFITALTLVSSLAARPGLRAGRLVRARRRRSTPGDVVALALLLTRLYAPLTALASARVEVMSALVSFERVFEVLDLKPLITERAGRPAGARRAGVGRVRRTSTSATRRPTRSRWPRWRRSPSSTPAAARRCCTTCRSAPSRAQMVALVGSSGAGQVDDRPAAARASTTSTPARSGWPGVDVRGPVRSTSIRGPLGHGHPGRAPVPRVDPRRTCCSARPEATDDELWDALRAGPARRAGRVAARRARHRRRRARLPALRRRAPAAHDRPAAAGPPPRRDPRRGDRAPGLHVRGRGAGRAGRGAGRPDRGRHRAPALDRPGRRPDPRGRGRPGRRARHAHVDCWPRGGRYEELHRTQFAEPAAEAA